MYSDMFLMTGAGNSVRSLLTPIPSADVDITAVFKAAESIHNTTNARTYTRAVCTCIYEQEMRVRSVLTHHLQNCRVSLVRHHINCD